MGELVAFGRRDSHEQLGLVALEHLRQGRMDQALRSLTQAWLDASVDRDDAWPIAEQMNRLLPNGGPGAA